MTSILRSISFNITQLAYPLISYLYNIFELIANNQYFSSETIETLSGNIYIVISVCMLFTLGLKLLTAIVNPEALTDSGGGSGKGVKRTAKNIFFSILFSVFLIILIPIGFRYLYIIQADILERQVVEKIVLGADSTEDHAPGQILASYAFASFCKPNETVSVESISNDGGNLYNLAITEDIENIKYMDGVINSKTDGKYDLNYNWILSPAVGVFLAYEMILTCMDIALRSIKLALLELITAIVLCAYIVSGTDILKRWAQEVFKTYINVFLKVAAMTFMVFGLSRLEEFLDSFDFSDSDADFMTKGLIRVFIIIGLLQMVKQIPNFINTIFGTNIQARGGIKGRLGEMAAVGQIAQQGWDKIRNKAIGFGALAAAGPAGWLGAAAAIGGGAAIKHGWNKGFKGQAPWKDTTGGRVLRHVGGVGKGIWTGAKSNKGIIGSISEGVKAYQDTEVAKSRAGAKENTKLSTMIGNMKKNNFGIGEDGRISAVVAGATEKDRTLAARAASNNLNNNIKTSLDEAGAGKYSKEVQNLASASRSFQLANAAKDSYKKIDDQLTSLREHATNEVTQHYIEDIQGKLRSGKMSAEEVLQAVDYHYGGDGTGSSGAGGSIKTDCNNLKTILESDVIDTNGNEVKLYEALKQTADGGIKISDINTETAALETVYNSRKSDITDAMEKGNATDFQKAFVNKTIEYVDLTNKTLADTQKKWNE